MTTSTDQTLRERTAAFIDEIVTPAAGTWERERAVPRHVFKEFAAAGLVGPATAGRNGFMDWLHIAEELYGSGFGGVALALLGNVGIAIEPLVSLGTPEQQERYLEPTLAGDAIAAIAITEPEAGSDVSGLKASATATDDGWELTGRKMFVSQGSQADFYIVAARTSGSSGARGISLFVVERATPGLEVVRRLDKLGMRSSDTAEVAFHSCRIPAAALLGEEGNGFRAVMGQFQGERLILAVGALAMAARATDEAMAYVSERRQFGVPIGSFQAIRHRIAAAASELAAIRSFTFETAEDYAAGGYPVTRIAMAKLLAARAACRIVDEMLQFHGGWGYITDHDLERIWRDVRLMRIGGGTDEIQLEIIAKQLGLPREGDGRSASPPRSITTVWQQHDNGNERSTT